MLAANRGLLLSHGLPTRTRVLALEVARGLRLSGGLP
jgi:hypothetical protein